MRQRFRLPLGSFAPYAAAIVIALALVLVPTGKSVTRADGGAALGFPRSDCSNGSTANVTFQWTPVAGASVHWLDISLADNGFAPGTFISAGPFSGSQAGFTWQGLLPGAVHYWRVNALTANGWVPSATGTFIPCGSGPVLLWGPTTCTSTTTAMVDFHWSPMSPQGTQTWVDLGFDPGFGAGNFVSAGPLSADTQWYHWDGLQGNVTYFFRINTQASDGTWHPTITGSLNAPCAPNVDTSLQSSNDTFAIPRLGISAPVNVRAVGADGQLGDPAGPYDVVRYDFSALYPGLGGYPGSGGTTVIAGHVDYHPNLEAIFWTLRNIQPGDEIDYYRGDGSMVAYSVQWSRDMGPEDDMSSLAVSTNPESMVLVTCDGTFNPATRHYDSRFVVEATRMN